MKKLTGKREISVYVDEALYLEVEQDARIWEDGRMPVWTIARWVREAIAQKLATGRKRRGRATVNARARAVRATGKTSRVI